MAHAGKPLPPQAYLLSLFEYNFDTGALTWRVNRRGRGARAGQAAGHLKPDGYINVTIDGLCYQAHRIIWKMVHGADPVALVDHRDGVGSNNRFLNLRQASEAQNMHNTRTPRSNTTGVKGVSFYKRTGRYQAQVRAFGRNLHVGYFATLQDAAAAIITVRCTAHSDFARAA